MKKIILVTLTALVAGLHSVHAGTITISATGLSSSPIFVTSTLGSISVGTEFRLGTFSDVTALNGIISTYKAGVIGTGTTTAGAQADADAKKSLLYSDTVSWLSNASNFTSIAAFASTITQAGTSASGKLLFNNTASRTVNGVSGSYGGVNGTMDVTYGNYTPGTGSKLWGWFATGTEIAIVTDSTWLVPVNNISGLSVGTAQIASTGSGDATELLLATYTDYSTGSDLISTVAAPVTLNVVPEPSSAALLMFGAIGLVALRRFRKV